MYSSDRKKRIKLIYKNIWLSPGQTFEELKGRSYLKSIFIVPFIILGLVYGLDFTPALSNIFGGENKLLSWIMSLAFGLIFTFFWLGLVLPGLIKLVGNFWNGPATFRQLINICSIAFIPYTFIIFYQLALLAFGKEPSLDQVNSVLDYLLRLWSFILLVIGVSRVQKFSYKIALVNILLCYLPLILVELIRVSG
ncbi:Yip1 family protein [Mangrovivirga cuniculi]|uniref:Yip1 domain-containing protein n=1 Tax=Mangrovivirga cuniculi TaxID=2715131 RepID=A0A4D7JP69_9BACT|nr:Yip1 family protein [Mangrovivirga cuniculi]QCK16563.1 hypothetical protein DCC35_18430 [Mangrovivirga cuniculi]